MSTEREMAEKLREFADIDEAEGGNPYVIAAEREAASLLETVAAERDALRREATDQRYMKQAYWHMLGPKGLEVAAMWQGNGVRRVHHSWGPEAINMTGEERAALILDWETAAREAVPVGSIDGPEAAIRSRSGSKP